MSEAPTANETPLWRFSLHFYRQAGVSDACIALQDECGVDVNLLLFLLWLATSRRQLSADDIREIDASVGAWRELTIIPIRNLRRMLKSAVTVVPANKQEALRTRIKAIELEAERLQQQALYDRGQVSPLGNAADPVAAAGANIAAYERLLGVTFPQAATDRLVTAFAAIKHADFATR
jgi:uncharacterized protein (TIGR02444 family)